MPQMKGFLSTVLTSCFSTSGFFLAPPALAATGSTGGKPTSSGLSLLRRARGGFVAAVCMCV